MKGLDDDKYKTVPFIAFGGAEKLTLSNKYRPVYKTIELGMVNALCTGKGDDHFDDRIKKIKRFQALVQGPV